MEQDLITRLKVKPVPKSIKTVEILLNKPDIKDLEEVFIKTNVVDKSRLGIIDRQAFLENIQQNVATRVEKLIKEEPDPIYQKSKKGLEENPKKFEPNIVLIMDIIKLGRNLKIGPDNIDSDIDIIS